MASTPETRRILQEQERTVEQIKKTLQDTFVSILTMQQVINALKSGNANFTLLRNLAIRQKVQDILLKANGDINMHLIRSTDRIWSISDENFWNKLQVEFPSDNIEYFKELQSIRDKAIEHQRSVISSAKAYLSTKRGGVSVSDRVWRITQSIPKEIDILIQNAVRQGLSADDLSLVLRKYLNEPERMYRRVLNKRTGKLEWSKAAEKYHPGQGVYRSSYKNAVRLARTEINKAYRYAEWLKYQESPLISAYEIRSTRQENTCPICAELEGTYPKNWKWDGWHPQCNCYMIPVQISRSEFVKRTKLKLEGRLDEYKAPPLLTELPENFTRWLKDNEERLLNAKSLPFWYQNNYDKIKSV